jgi:hypothetical protein
MRTTLQIDDDVYTAAVSLARSEGKTVGEIISRLARRGLNPPARTRRKGEFPIFKVSRAAKPITAEMVQRALDESP